MKLHVYMHESINVFAQLIHCSKILLLIGHQRIVLYCCKYSIHIHARKHGASYYADSVSSSYKQIMHAMSNR